jgi:hypothetical protein
MLSLVIPSNDTVNTSFDASSNGSSEHSLDHSFNYSLLICCFNNFLNISLIQWYIASLLASTSHALLDLHISAIIASYLLQSFYTHALIQNFILTIIPFIKLTVSITA